MEAAMFVFEPSDQTNNEGSGSTDVQISYPIKVTNESQWNTNIQSSYLDDETTATLKIKFRA